MMRARIGEYWDSDRATYEDELDAWRERTAPVAAEPTTLVHRPRRTTARRPALAGPMSSSPTEPAAQAA